MYDFKSIGRAFLNSGVMVNRVPRGAQAERCPYERIRDCQRPPGSEARPAEVFGAGRTVTTHRPQGLSALGARSDRVSGAVHAPTGPSDGWCVRRSVMNLGSHTPAG